MDRFRGPGIHTDRAKGPVLVTVKGPAIDWFKGPAMDWFKGVTKTV